MPATFWVLALRRIFRRFPVGWLARLLSLNKWRVAKLVEEPDLSLASPLRESETRLIRAWWLNDSLRDLADGISERLNFYLFKNIYLSANRRGGLLFQSPHLIVPHTGLAPPARVFFPNTDVAGILDQAGYSVLLRTPKPTQIFERGIFAGSMAPHNWFHWIIDNLPSFYMARFLPEALDEYPLFVPEVALQRPHWIEPLDLVTGGREIVGVPGERWVSVDSLVRLDGVTRPNPRSLVGPCTARISILRGPFLNYRDHLLQSLGLSSREVVPGRRIFLARKADEVRRYNQEEIFEVAREFGFEYVHLDEMDFYESVALFREVEVVVGPHGAAWANLIFAHSSAKTMLWTWPGEQEDNWYENVALISGVSYLQIFATVGHSASGAHVDPRIADYHLDRIHFRESLQELLGRKG